MTTTARGRRPLRRLAIACLVAGVLASPVALLHNAPARAAAPLGPHSGRCTAALSARDQIHQLAVSIARSHGTPTAAGRRVLRADAAADPTLASDIVGGAAAGAPSLDVTILATHARPLSRTSAGALGAVRHRTAPTGRSKLRRPQAVHRLQGWGGYYYYFCGGGIRANLSFWCHAGGSCAASAFFSDGEVLSSNYPYCPGPGPGSCLTTARAQPGNFTVWVDWIRPYQSYTGAPQGYAQWCGP
jgi:hypothetical protein